MRDVFAAGPSPAGNSEVPGSGGRQPDGRFQLVVRQVAAHDGDALDELGNALHEEDREGERDQKLHRPLRQAAEVRRLLVLHPRRDEEVPGRVGDDGRHRQQEEDVADDFDGVARPAGKRSLTMSMRMCSLRASVHGAASRNTAANSHHCNSSQALELMSKSLRMMALPALMTAATTISQATDWPSQRVAASIQRLSVSNACMTFPRASRLLAVMRLAHDLRDGSPAPYTEPRQRLPGRRAGPSTSSTAS